MITQRRPPLPQTLNRGQGQSHRWAESNSVRLGFNQNCQSSGHAKASHWDSFHKHLSRSGSMRRWHSVISTVTSVFSHCEVVWVVHECVCMHTGKKHNNLNPCKTFIIYFIMSCKQAVARLLEDLKSRVKGVPKCWHQIEPTVCRIIL